MIFEIAVDTLEGAQAAKKAGATRLEVCSALKLGGITPSAGLLKLIRQHINLPIHALIRPREGDFLYSPAEIETMLADIESAQEAGADGIVIGALKTDGSLDVKTLRRLIQKASPTQVTFHRAFDVSSQPALALEQLVELGVQRLLTSGGAPNAFDGRHHLAALVQQAGDRLVVMPGGGITEANIAKIVHCTGASEIHFSARSVVESPALFQKPGFRVGKEDDLASRQITDPDRIRSMIALARAAQAGESG